MPLPEYRAIPAGFNHRSGLKKRGLVSTANPVAIHVYRHHDSVGRCELFDLRRTHRLADINGQPSLF